MISLTFDIGDGLLERDRLFAGCFGGIVCSKGVQVLQLVEKLFAVLQAEEDAYSVALFIYYVLLFERN